MTPRQFASTNTADPVSDGQRSVTTHIGDLAVYDTGTPSLSAQGETLVLWPALLTDHHIFDAQVAALRERHRLVLLDGPGHGASGLPTRSFSMADCAQAVAQVLDALEIRQPVVCIGCSWGGAVAGEFALHHADRTRAVVLLNPPVFKSSAWWSDHVATWGARWLKSTNVYVQGVAEGYFMPETRKREAAFMAEFGRHIRRTNASGLSRAARAVLLEREELASRLKNVTAPTLFIAGTHDTMCRVDDQRRAAAQLPRGQFVELPTAHISVVDAPAQTTLAIDSFLNGL